MGIWISDERLMGLPTTGAAWDAVVAGSEALALTTRADLDNQDEKIGEDLMAAALRYRRTGHVASKEAGVAVLATAPESENGGRTLALGRNLASYIIAADLLEYRPDTFVAWARGVRRETLDGMTLIECQEKRGNNWGTAATASLIAVDLYLGDTTDLARAVRVFRGWLGDRSQYSGHDWGDLKWQANPAAPVGINPKGSQLGGYSVDGCLPDDQRREAGTYAAPPAVNYVRAAITHQYVSATLLWQAGYSDAFDWSDQALRRAVLFFRDRCGGTFSGDDAWCIPLIEWAYPGLEVGADVPGSLGKGFAWAAWTHGNWERTSAEPPPPPPPPPDPDPDPVDPCASVKAELADARGEIAALSATLAAAEGERAEAEAALAVANAKIARARAELA